MWIHTDDGTRLQDVYRERLASEREIGARAIEAQSLAKRSQFALHRGDIAGGRTLLDEARVAKAHLLMTFGEERLAREGAFRALEEELLESELFAAFVDGEKPLQLPVEKPLATIGACSDLLGEVVRLLVRDASQGSFARLSDAQVLAEEVLTLLLELDATGNARQKLDQARSHARKIEDIAYDVAMRRTVV